MKYTIPDPNAKNENWERQTLEKLLLEAWREQRRARVWKLIYRLIWLVFAALFLMALLGRSDGTTIRPGASEAHTALIHLEGAISSNEDQIRKLREGLEDAYDNKNVKGIIIEANSPGGSPVISNVAFEEIRRLKAAHPNIPLYVVANDVCASGCYYIATAADKIYADPASLVGSIGVIGSSFDFTGLMDKLGIQRRLRTAGDNKGMGDPFSPETPEQKAIWQSMLDDIHQQFIQAVKTGRGERLKDAQYPDVFSGRVYTGNQALQVGLIDGLGNVYSVSRDIIKAPKLIDYTPEDSLRSALSKSLGASVQEGVSQGLSSQTW